MWPPPEIASMVSNTSSSTSFSTSSEMASSLSVCISSCEFRDTGHDKRRASSVAAARLGVDEAYAVGMYQWDEERNQVALMSLRRPVTHHALHHRLQRFYASILARFLRQVEPILSIFAPAGANMSNFRKQILEVENLL